MSGFYVLDVPEFASLIDAATKSGRCTVHAKRGHYQFVEFDNEIEYPAPRHAHERGGVVRLPDRRTRRQDHAFRWRAAQPPRNQRACSWPRRQMRAAARAGLSRGHAHRATDSPGTSHSAKDRVHPAIRCLRRRYQSAAPRRGCGGFIFLQRDHCQRDANLLDDARGGARPSLALASQYWPGARARDVASPARAGDRARIEWVVTDIADTPKLKGWIDHAPAAGSCVTTAWWRCGPSRGASSIGRANARESASSKQHLYSITSSARASSVGGTSRPSALAVLRLITSSYLVGACTGRSAGFSPLRMRST